MRVRVECGKLLIEYISMIKQVVLSLYTAGVMRAETSRTWRSRRWGGVAPEVGRGSTGGGEGVAQEEVRG